MFILEMMRQESGFCRTARSGKNAHGLMQFIPSTAKRFGVHNPNDPVEAITGACRYIKYLADLSYIHNDPGLVLAGYNAGEGAVKLAGGRVPAIAETRQYVASIMAGYRRARELQSQISGRQAALQPVRTCTLGSWTARAFRKSPSRLSPAFHLWVSTHPPIPAAQMDSIRRPRTGVNSCFKELTK
jgi:hypothetical protein